MIFFSRRSAAQPADLNQRSRRKGCWSVVIILVVLYVASSFLFGMMFGNMFSSTASLDKNTVYVLNMKGVVVEQGKSDIPFASALNDMPGYNKPETVGLDDLLDNIRFAKTDDRVRGILLRGGELQIGFASAKALRDALIDFKQSGKFVVAYAPAYSQINYYIASVADSIYLNPVGSVDWNGLSANKMYFKRALDKLGVEMQVIKVGTFKSAVEPYILTGMSDADRRQTAQYVNGLWQAMVDGVAESRSICAEQLNAYADRYMGLQPAEEYLKAGLVDSLIYTEDLDSLLIRLTDCKDYNKITTSELATIDRPAVKAKDHIAVLYADGEITDDQGTGIVGTKMVKEIAKIRKDDKVKAVVLRVNSPGGSADASEQIWHAVQTLREKGLPVVVSMGDYAASGGYYISCGADYIYAEPTTITGSIGIFGLIPNLGKIRDKIGVDIDGLTTNRHSALAVNAQWKGMNDAEQALMQQMVNRGYDLFTRRCAEGRHMPQDSIKAIAEGRVWLGSRALELGLVDKLGNMDNAVSKAAELAGVSNYDISYYPGKKAFFTQLMESLNGMGDEEKLMMRLRSLTERPRVMMLMHTATIE